MHLLGSSYLVTQTKPQQLRSQFRSYSSSPEKTEEREAKGLLSQVYMSCLNELMIGLDQSPKDWTADDVKTKFFAQNPKFGAISSHFEGLSGADLLGLTNEDFSNIVGPSQRALGTVLFNTLQSLSQTKQGACLKFSFFSTKKRSFLLPPSSFLLPPLSLILTHLF